MRLQLVHIRHVKILNTFDITWEVVCVRCSISFSYHPGDSSSSHWCLSTEINTTTGKNFLFLISLSPWCHSWLLGEPLCLLFCVSPQSHSVLGLLSKIFVVQKWTSQNPFTLSACQYERWIASAKTCLEQRGHRPDWKPPRWWVLNLSRNIIWGTSLSHEEA